MRPRFTWHKALLLALALALVGGLFFWLSRGAPLIGGNKAPDTAGKIAFVSDKNGSADLWLMNGADGGEAVALTTDPTEDRSPAWSPRGDALAFISDRSGGYQVFVVEPRSGAEPRPLTITSSAKDAPAWGRDGRVYYLASGQLVATEPGTSDADAILPSADLRLQLSNLLSSGGFSWARVSPDGRAKAAVLRLESGEALLFSPPESESVLLLGLGKDIEAVWLRDNTLAAAFVGGAPGPQPVPLLDEARLADPQHVAPSLPALPEIETNFLAHFGPDGAPRSAGALEPVVSGLAVSPDGKQAALTSEEGVFLVPLSGGEFARVHEAPAADPAWSPDGKTLAFVSGKDIWTISGAGASAATNLTRGALGQCASPVWSPATASPATGSPATTKR
ncbi:MAG: PD40 domain-containing protein [Acetobacteraceae bacterium]|nr:PD40 domain-containing protein [Acetobacteraceae bacterium]